jgi:hypothetical protein
LGFSLRLERREDRQLTICSTPEEGDLVIRRDMRDGERVYVLHTAPGADQILLRTRDEAIAHATGFAACQGVRVWIKTEGRYSVLQDFRSVRGDPDRSYDDTLHSAKATQNPPPR